MTWGRTFSGLVCYLSNFTTMGFIKNALIGVALYEAVKYFLRKEDRFKLTPDGSQDISPSRGQLRGEEVDIIAGARQTDHLKQMKENASSSEVSENVGLVSEPQLSKQDSADDLLAGTDPETPLTGNKRDNAERDAWKNSLANDDLRAPDS